jgi:hypothetical protein
MDLTEWVYVAAATVTYHCYILYYMDLTECYMNSFSKFHVIQNITMIRNCSSCYINSFSKVHLIQKIKMIRNCSSCYMNSFSKVAATVSYHCYILYYMNLTEWVDVAAATVSHHCYIILHGPYWMSSCSTCYSFLSLLYSVITMIRNCSSCYINSFSKVHVIQNITMIRNCSSCYMNSFSKVHVIQAAASVSYHCYILYYMDLTEWVDVAAATVSYHCYILYYMNRTEWVDVAAATVTTFFCLCDNIKKPTKSTRLRKITKIKKTSYSMP